MSQESTRIVNAECDKAVLTKIREAGRDALLSFLSEARMLSKDMDANVRDRLMDDLSKSFHPDEAAADLFSDGFYEAENMLDQIIENNETEILVAKRRSGSMSGIAAE